MRDPVFRKLNNDTLSLQISTYIWNLNIAAHPVEIANHCVILLEKSSEGLVGAASLSGSAFLKVRFENGIHLVILRLVWIDLAPCVAVGHKVDSASVAIQKVRDLPKRDH